MVIKIVNDGSAEALKTECKPSQVILGRKEFHSLAVKLLDND